MGLAEKRAIEGFKTNKFIDFQKQIESVIGMTVSYDIAWDDFASQLEGRSDATEAMNEYMSGMFFMPMINAFKSICADYMGKTALKSSLKKIQMLNTNSYYYGETGASYEAGVLKLDFYYTNADQITERETAIRTKIEATL